MKMLSLEEVKSLPHGKGCVIESSYTYTAMYVGSKESGVLRFITDNGTLCRFKIDNYGITWKIVNTI